MQCILEAVDGEYEQYVEHLWNENVRPIAESHRPSPRRFPGEPWTWQVEEVLSQIRRASDVLDAIRGGLDPYDLRTARLRRMISDVKQALRDHSALLESFGFADVIDSDYSMIARGMRPQHLPLQEADLMRELGFPRLAESLGGIVASVRQFEAGNSSDYRREVTPTRELERVVQVLDQMDDRLEKMEGLEDRLADLNRRQADAGGEDLRSIAEQRSEIAHEIEAIKPKRRWFKGLGQVAQGIALSTANIGLAAGAFKFQVSEETQTWGCLISVTTGVGTAMKGAGDLRGE